MSDLRAPLSPELVRRLAVPTPRYTSYPTVPEWSNAFGPDDFLAALRRAGERRDEPLSLYVHIPFCHRRCTYCGCNVVVTNDPHKADRYLDALDQELETVARALGDRRSLARVHLGGGTPTFLDNDQLERLWRSIQARFHVLTDAEVALEVDPTVTSDGQLALLAQLGFWRLSVGVQDLDPAVQAGIGRIQSFEDTARVIEKARAAGFRSVNIDLVYGLPRQTPESFDKTIAAMLPLKPDRVAAFSFAFVPEARPHQRRLPIADLPSPEQKIVLREVVAGALGRAGYTSIGMDHWAVPEDELARALETRTLWRDFQGYTTRRARETLAVGVSGISDIGGAYAQNGLGLAEHRAAAAAGRPYTQKGVWLTDDDERRREVITQLLCNLWVDLGPDGATLFAPELAALAPLATEGLVTVAGNEVTVTERGRAFVRNVACAFDAYLGQGAKRTFSSAV